MTVPKTGISDQVLINNSSGTEITDALGRIQAAGFDINEPAPARATANSEASYAYIIDGPITINTNLEVRILDLSALRLFGTYDDGAGTVTFDDTIPEHTVKIQHTKSQHTVLSNVKFGRGVLEVNMSDSDPEILLTAEGMGLDYQMKDSTISPTTTSSMPVDYMDATVKIDGTEIGTLENLRFTYDRGIESRSSAGDIPDTGKRLPNYIAEKLKTFTFDGTFEIPDDTVFKKAVGDTTYPMDPQDSRSNITIQIDLGDAGTFQLTDARINGFPVDVSDDGEIRTVAVSGNALSASVTGI